MKIRDTLKQIFGVGGKVDYAVSRYHKRQWCFEHQKRHCVIHGKHKAIYSRRGYSIKS